MSHPFISIEAAELEWQDGLPFCKQTGQPCFSIEHEVEKRQNAFIIGNKLLARWALLDEQEAMQFVIAETHFGSGFHFLLVWFLWLSQAPKLARLHFISYEKYPLNKADLARCLAFYPTLQKQAAALLADYPVLTPGFHHLSFDNGRINLTLMLGDTSSCFNQLLICSDSKLERQLRAHHVDAWFLGELAPLKKEDVAWNELFHSISLLSKAGTTLVSLSTAEATKQALQVTGFHIAEKQSSMNKQFMLLGQFQESAQTFSRSRQTPWHLYQPTAIKTRKAIVIGAGLAGCYSAHALAKRGWQVTLLDEHSEVGGGASGNEQAILYPKLSAYRSPLNTFMLSAFLFAHRAYSQWLKTQSFGCLSGLLQFAFNNKERAALAHLEMWLDRYPELGKHVNQQEASSIAGIDLQSDALFIPRAGWINSPALCQWLLQTSGIHWVPSTAVSQLMHSERGWQVADHVADVVILANGPGVTQYIQTAHIPLKCIQGQMTSVAATAASKRLRVPLCGDAHILPEMNGVHAIGATYHQGVNNAHCISKDNNLNLDNLGKIPTTLEWSSEVKGSWQGIRVATPDYLPLVGPAPNELLFNEQFRHLCFDANRWLPYPGIYYPGLFVCSGFGSRGLISIPISAEWLASFINQEPSFLSRAMIQSLSPARFLRKNLIKN